MSTKPMSYERREEIKRSIALSERIAADYDRKVSRAKAGGWSFHDAAEYARRERKRIAKWRTELALEQA